MGKIRGLTSKGNGMKTRFLFKCWLSACVTLLSLFAQGTNAATDFRFFFPIPNSPFNTIDDEIEVLSIKWSAAEQPVEWVLMKPGNGPVLLPTFNLNNISDADVLDAVQISLQEWNDNDLSSFDFEDDVLYSSSGAVPNPHPIDALFDGHNVITFQSLLVTLDSGVIAVTSTYFMESDFDLEEFMGMPIDQIEGTVVIPLDLDLDGFVDHNLDPRNYSRGEILETDIIFNSAFTYYQWPQDQDDIDPLDLQFLMGSLDIQSTLVHELGHALGVGHTYINAATMSPFLRGPTDDFPSNPYSTRSLEYDDHLGAGLLYPGSPSGGTINGWVIDGQSVEIYKALPEPVNLEAVNPALNDLLFVVQAPVFVGRPAPPGLHPDNVVSEEGMIRVIGQVLSGQELRYPAAGGGAGTLGPAFDLIPNIDFGDNGEDLDADGILDVGEDVNNNGVLDETTRDIDSKFSFPGLNPRDDYAIYIDPNRLGASGPAAINYVYGFLSLFEAFPAEFYGGTAPSADLIDDATGDDPLKIEFISVTEGGTADDIIIVTNVDNTGGDDETTPDGDPSPPLTFIDDTDATPNSDYVPLGADMGDLNGDGYPDFVVAVFTGGGDPSALYNRVYLNVPTDALDPDSPRKFIDISFGEDGIPGTLDDVLPAHLENSRDAKLGDFNNDGRLDLYIANAADANSDIGEGGFNRLYTNEEDLGNPYGFRFMDVSAATMPGLLNRGWDPTTPASAAPGLFADGRADSTHAAVGDIDGDGDLDIIQSLFTPAIDATAWSGGSPTDATVAMVDSQPSADGSAGDAKLTLWTIDQQQPDIVSATVQRPYQFPLLASTDIVTSNGLTFDAGPLVFCEQVLINHFYDDTNPGFFFVDETLGADNRFGDETIAPTVFAADAVPTDSLNRFGGFLIFTENTDRMPPVMPGAFNYTFSTTSGFSKGALKDSPMGYRAFEPRLGPMYQDTGLDLTSVRAFTDLPFAETVDNFAQSAFFDNIDINDDGRPDGYFACTNYNFDYHDRIGSGWFPVRQISVPVSVDSDGVTTTLETQPLLIGVPDGYAGDVNGLPYSNERDIYPIVNRGGFTGVIGDWEYRGAPKPMTIADNSFGAGTVYFPYEEVSVYRQVDGGARRGQNASVAGIGVNFLPTFPDTLALIPLVPISPQTVIKARDIPATLGEAHGSAAADFNNDGDFDVTTANTVSAGYLVDGTVIVTDIPTTNNLLTNNGFGVFTDVTNAAFPSSTLLNPPDISYQALAGDVDNDADQDIVFVNALTKHQLLVNQIYDPLGAPDLESTTDSTMFYDQSPGFIPPVYSGSLEPPFDAGTQTGISTSVAAADFNNDGLPDVTTAEGGTYSQGDFPLFFMNGGPKRQEPFRPFNDGVQVFRPLGSGTPQASVAAPPYVSLNYRGFLLRGIRPASSYRAANYGVSVGDFSGDGYPDLFYSRNGEGPISFLNVDGSILAGMFLVPETSVNSYPDLNIIPDGVLMDLDDIETLPGYPVMMPDLTDPCPDPSGSVVLKKLNRRLAAADFDDNGTLDVCLANGTLGIGAPNALLLNYPSIVYFPTSTASQQFVDATETNLPTVLGDCGSPTGIFDDTYDIAAADFDHDGDIDMVFANATETSFNPPFPGFRYLRNDGTGVFEDRNLIDGNVPEYLGDHPAGVSIGDFDGVGEPGEDVNGNGVLDQGEDLNSNSMLDFTDLPDETVAGDVNGDGIITKRTPGVWEPSFDIFVSFKDRTSTILINDPTNTNPGIFSDESAIRLPPFPLDGSMLLQSGDSRVGDLDLDGDLDIVVAKQTLNSFMRPVQFLLNDGTGFFEEASKEFPFPKSVRHFTEVGPNSLSNTGNASDIELLDVDRDGDLDVWVAMSGRNESLVVIGAMDVFYVNRIRGGNFNTGALELPPTVPAAPKPPLVFAAYPSVGIKGTTGQTVQVAGKDFDATTSLSFGSGVTVNSLTYINANRVDVNLDIAPGAQVGQRSVGVSNTSTGLSSTTVPGVYNVDTQDVDDNAVGSVWTLFE